MPSPIYGFPQLTGTTSERVSTNLTFQYVESLFGSAPTGINVSTPPSSPEDGSVYLINGTPTGIWTGKAGEVGVYTSSGWFYTTRHPYFNYVSSSWVPSSLLSFASIGTRNTFTQSQGVAPVALTDGATIPVDAALSNNFTVTLGGNRQFLNPTNMVAGYIYNYFIGQDATGNRVPTWDTDYNFGDDGVPTPSTGANKVDWLSFYCNGTQFLFAGIKKGF
jgi:hypothetical protein